MLQAPHPGCARFRRCRHCARCGYSNINASRGPSSGVSQTISRPQRSSSVRRTTATRITPKSARRNGSATKSISPKPARTILPHLITDVETTPGPTADGEMTPVIHAALAQRELLPAIHLVDTGFLDAALLVSSRADYQVDLVGPTRSDYHWQAREGTGFAVAHFQVDWEQQRATCPAGHTSISWTPAVDKRTNQVIKIKFSTPRLSPLSASQSVHPFAGETPAAHDHGASGRGVPCPAGGTSAGRDGGIRRSICQAGGDRRNTLAGHSHLSAATDPLYRLGESALGTSADGGGTQLLALGRVVRRHSMRQDTPFAVCHVDGSMTDSDFASSITRGEPSGAM